MEKEQWRKRVIAGASTLGIAVSAEQARQLEAHAEALLTWNRTSNLTAITDPEEVALKHYVDALAPAPLIAKGARILDAGSGGGFPGIPLKIVRPDVSLTLVDSVRKKISFLKFAIRDLGLRDVFAVQGRMEDLGRCPHYHKAFDLVVSRAFSSLETFAALGVPFLRPGGCLLAMKGPPAGHCDEIPSAGQDGTVRLGGTDFYLNTHAYRLPHIDAKRRLVWLIRKKALAGDGPGRKQIGITASARHLFDPPA